MSMQSIKRRWVHIDLKGMAPTVSSLLASFDRFTSWGVNGFLFELEDMFPYKTAQQSIRKDCYKREEWLKIFYACRDKGAEFVPLVQTLGHLEWLLWHQDFAHLRAVEAKNESGSRNISQMQPCTEEGRTLVIALISEVIDLFSDLNYLHLGGDETAFLGNTPSSSYLNHMLPIIEYVISRDVTPMIWSDIVLSFFDIIDKIPAKVIYVDWNYIPRSQTGEKSHVWGAGMKPFSELSESRKREFGEHIYRGLDYGGKIRRQYTFPSYFRSRDKPFFVVPAAQCGGNPFTHPTVYWRLDNARSYCREGYENDAAGAIDSDWIVRRNMRELTRLCHYGFAQNSLDPLHGMSNEEVVQAYWDEIFPGSGERAFEIFNVIGEARGTYFDESRPLFHEQHSTHWHVTGLNEKEKQARYRPGDLDEKDEKVQITTNLVKVGKALAEFCEPLIPHLEGEKKAEAEAWRLSGLDISFRARLWFLVRDKQKGKDIHEEKEALMKETKRLEKEFRDFWKGRYLESDMEDEMKWRFHDIIEYLKASQTLAG